MTLGLNPYQNNFEKNSNLIQFELNAKPSHFAWRWAAEVSKKQFRKALIEAWTLPSAHRKNLKLTKENKTSPL